MSQTIIHFKHTSSHFDNFKVLNLSFQQVVTEFSF